MTPCPCPRRLYVRVFHILLAFVLIAIILSALASHLLLSEVVGTHLSDHFSSRAWLFAQELPPAGCPDVELQATLERVSEKRRFNAVVWGKDGRRLAFTCTGLPAPSLSLTTSQLLRTPLGPALAVPLPDGRCLVLQPKYLPRPFGFLLAVAAVAGVLALASYPVARLVTRRLEALEIGVRRLGEGDLTSRVEVKGEDELASLASSFNQAAERLQTLVEGQRRVLASASHELRSPLTRLRMALELAREAPERSGDRIDEAVDEVVELDSLVEELLLAGRLEVQGPVRPAETVDVGDVLVAEAVRVGAATTIAPSPLHVEARLLKVMLRNLLENARRHGLGSGVEAGVEPLAGSSPGVRVWVADRGPGVVDCERERIFEPFYRPAGFTEGRDGGVGLGLYLVRRIARWYGGDATCLPRDGGGTLFNVTLYDLPRTDGPSASKA